MKLEKIRVDQNPFELGVRKKHSHEREIRGLQLRGFALHDAEALHVRGEEELHPEVGLAAQRRPRVPLREDVEVKGQLRFLLARARERVPGNGRPQRTLLIKLTMFKYHTLSKLSTIL